MGEEMDPVERALEETRRAIAAARAQLSQRERERRDARRQYAREYYAAHREEYLEYQRQYRAEKRAQDPDGYREAKRERNQRWRDTHKDEVNARLRGKYRADPEKHRERRRAYYADHAEEQRARRRDYYARNKEKQLAKQRAWREREKRRRAAGLPPTRLHRVHREERHANTAAADLFFAREWSAAEVAEATKSMATPPKLIAAWERECAKARATYTLAEQQEELARLQKELARGKSGPKPRPTAREIEDARMDAVAKAINDRLRVTGQPRRPAHPDPAAPHPMLHPGMSPRGLNR